VLWLGLGLVLGLEVKLLGMFQQIQINNNQMIPNASLSA
jgi:hypothetical protein